MKGLLDLFGKVKIDISSPWLGGWFEEAVTKTAETIQEWAHLIGDFFVSLGGHLIERIYQVLETLVFKPADAILWFLKVYFGEFLPLLWHEAVVTPLKDLYAYLLDPNGFLYNWVIHPISEFFIQLGLEITNSPWDVVDAMLQTWYAIVLVGLIGWLTIRLSTIHPSVEAYIITLIARWFPNLDITRHEVLFRSLSQFVSPGLIYQFFLRILSNPVIDYLCPDKIASLWGSLAGWLIGVFIYFQQYDKNSGEAPRPAEPRKRVHFANDVKLNDGGRHRDEYRIG